MEPVIVFISLFGTIFGIIYLYFSTRNKERMALIEKGADASIFFSNKERKTAPIWKILIINLALLMVGIGVGIFVASVLHYNMGVEDEVAFPGTIFLMSGLGLLAGFYLSKRLAE